MGVKVGDDHTAPLCDGRHREYHQTGRIGAWSYEETDRKLNQAAVEAAELSRSLGILEPRK